jgi:hypothetical protein
MVPNKLSNVVLPPPDGPRSITNSPLCLIKTETSDEGVRGKDEANYYVEFLVNFVSTKIVVCFVENITFFHW